MLATMVIIQNQKTLISAYFLFKKGYKKEKRSNHKQFETKFFNLKLLNLKRKSWYLQIALKRARKAFGQVYLQVWTSTSLL